MIPLLLQQSDFITFSWVGHLAKLLISIFIEMWFNTWKLFLVISLCIFYYYQGRIAIPVISLIYRYSMIDSKTITKSEVRWHWHKHGFLYSSVLLNWNKYIYIYSYEILVFSRTKQKFFFSIYHMIYFMTVYEDAKLM